MYPFSTNKKITIVSSSEHKVEKILKENIARSPIMDVRSDDKFFGRIYNNKAVFYMGQFPRRNGWRPVVTLRWKPKDGGTEITSYYGLSKSIYLAFITLPLFGAYLSVSYNTIAPVLFTLTFYLVFIYGLSFILYNNSKESTSRLLQEILNKIP